MAVGTPGDKKHVYHPQVHAAIFPRGLFMILLDGLSKRGTTHSLP